MVSAPLLYIQEKCSADRAVTCQGQTSLEAEPGPGPPHSAQHVPSCQPASSSGPSLRPAGEDVDQILCPLSLRFATHRAASPALGPTNLWKLESVSPQQKTVVSGLPFPPGGSWAPNLQSLYPQQGSVSAKSESVSSPSAPSEAGTFPPWLLPKPQTQVLLSSRRGLDLAFP